MENTNLCPLYVNGVDISDLLEERQADIKSATEGLKDDSLVKSLTKSQRESFGEEPFSPEQIKKGESFSFFNASSLRQGLQEFFADNYVAKQVAKKSLEFDEDDSFVEEFQASNPLGYTYENGEAKKSAFIKVKMKVLPYGERNKETGYPFEISLSLIAEDNEEQEENQVEDQADEEVCEYRQLTIYDWLGIKERREYA